MLLNQLVIFVELSLSIFDGLFLKHDIGNHLVYLNRFVTNIMGGLFSLNFLLLSLGDLFTCSHTFIGDSLIFLEERRFGFDFSRPLLVSINLL